MRATFANHLSHLEAANEYFIQYGEKRLDTLVEAEQEEIRTEIAVISDSVFSDCSSVKIPDNLK